MTIDDVLLGKAIARFREMRGLTQTQLNKMIEMSTIQHIEQGRNTVSVSCLNKIAHALDVPAACLVLLGSKIKAGDKVLSSLRSLLEKTMSYSASEKPMSKARSNLSRAGAKHKSDEKVAVKKKQKSKASYVDGG